MSNTVQFVVTFADVAGFPATQSVHDIAFAVTDSTGAVVGKADVAPPAAGADLTVSIDGIPDGVMSYTITANDPAGAALGTPVTGTFTAPAPTIVLSLPATATAVASVTPTPAP